MDSIKLKRLFFLVESGVPALVLIKINSIREVAVLLEQIDNVKECKFVQIGPATRIEHELNDNEFSMALLTVVPQECGSTIARLERYREAIRKCGKLVMLALYPEQSDCMKKQHLDLMDQVSYVEDFTIGMSQPFRPIFTFEKLYTKGKEYGIQAKALNTKLLLSSELRGNTLDSLNDAVDRIHDSFVSKKYIVDIREAIMSSLASVTDMYSMSLFDESTVLAYLDVGVRYLETLLGSGNNLDTKELMHIIITTSINSVMEVNDEICSAVSEYAINDSLETILRLCFFLDSIIKDCLCSEENSNKMAFLKLLSRCEYVFVCRFMLQCDYTSAYRISVICSKSLMYGNSVKEYRINFAVVATECSKGLQRYIFALYENLRDNLYSELSLERKFLVDYNLAITKLYFREYIDSLNACNDFLQECKRIKDMDNTLVVRMELLKYWIEAIYTCDYEGVAKKYFVVLKRAEKMFSENHYFIVIGIICYVNILINCCKILEEPSRNAGYSKRVVVDSEKLVLAQNFLEKAKRVLKNDQIKLRREQLLKMAEELSEEINNIIKC